MSGYIGTQPVPQATQTRDTFTATAGQTSFATSGYTPSFLDVFLNGVHLVNGTDYTATNGSDVVLTSGAADGDVLEVLSFGTFQSGDFVPTSGGTFTGSVTVPSLTSTGAMTGTNLTLSGGVYLGGTGAANYLDDYEEGTFTPSYTPSTGAFTSITYSRQVGTYTKIGRAVYCNLSIATASLNPSGGSGNVRITGLPFTPAYNTTIYAAQNNNWASNPPNCGRNTASGFIEVGYNDAYNNQFVQVSDMNTATATRNEFNSDFVYYIA